MLEEAERQLQMQNQIVYVEETRRDFDEAMMDQLEAE